MERNAKQLSKPRYNQKLRAAWVQTQKRACQVCGISEGLTYSKRYPAGLQVHHLIKRPRSDEWCNLLLVCSRCHMRIEGERVAWAECVYGPLGDGVALWCKQRRDPENWDEERLLELWGRACLPDLVPFPIR